MRVIQLISPDTVAGAQGFSPRPNPRLIATYPTKGEAIAVSRGLERDRVVDETGGQTVVFGRRGSRPFHLNEMERFYLHSEFGDAKDGSARRGSLYRVEDVISRDGKLMTKSGVFLSPLVTPALRRDRHARSARLICRDIEPPRWLPRRLKVAIERSAARCQLVPAKWKSRHRATERAIQPQFGARKTLPFAHGFQ